MLPIRTRVATAAVAVALFSAPAFSQPLDPDVVLAQQDPVVVGELTITLAWARATPPGAPTAASYLTITNAGAIDDALLAVSSPIAAVGQIHEMIMDGDRTMMRMLEDGLPIPAGSTVVLQPGGLHLMFADIADRLAEGTIIDAVLTFAGAGSVGVTFVVYPIGSPGPAAVSEMERDGMNMRLP